MKKLFIDIETYSDVDLRTSNITKYTSSKDFEIMLIAYSYDQGPINLIDCTIIPEYDGPLDFLIQELRNPEVIKIAHNSVFELTCFCSFFGIPFQPEQWQCTMVMCAALNLPLALGQVSEILRLPGKIGEGKKLIEYFCKPCKPTKTNGQRTRNLPYHAPDKWQLFGDYCKQDVQAEIDLYNKISWIWDEISQDEKEIWYLDQRINRNGVRIDLEFVKKAYKMDKKFKDWVKDRLQVMTNLENPNSLPQLKKWILDETGIVVDSITKDTTAELVKTIENPLVKRVLETRLLLGKSSTAKYNMMLEVEHENHIHNLFAYRATMTDRWAGRLIQPHNLPRNKLEDIHYTRLKYLNGTVKETDPLIPFELSQLIRTALVPELGEQFYVIDYSSIEARVIAWLAGESWVLDVFRNNGDIYTTTAAKMFNIPEGEVTKEMRNKYGKVAVLSCGYQGSIGAVRKFVTPDWNDEECMNVVEKFRSANPNIIKLWSTLDNMVKLVIQYKRDLVYAVPGETSCLRVYLKKGFLVLRLPGGRELFYARPSVNLGHNGFNSIYYWSIHPTKKFLQTESYGGKFVENIVQSIARDILALAMLGLSKEGYDIRLHIHDELVISIEDIDTEQEIRIKDIMCRPHEWCKTLPLNAEGFVTDYYRKE